MNRESLDTEEGDNLFHGQGGINVEDGAAVGLNLIIPWLGDKHGGWAAVGLNLIIPRSGG